jgi:hypothetical protein
MPSTMMSKLVRVFNLNKRLVHVSMNNLGPWRDRRQGDCPTKAQRMWIYHELIWGGIGSDVVSFIETYFLRIFIIVRLLPTLVADVDVMLQRDIFVWL